MAHVRWQHWALFVTAAAVAALLLRSDLRPMREGYPKPLQDYDLNDLQRSLPADVTLGGAPILGVDGIAVTRGGIAEAHFLFHGSDPERFIGANLWMYRQSGVANRIECSIDGGQTFTAAATNVSGEGVFIPLRPCRQTGALIVRIVLDGSAVRDRSQHLALDKAQFMSLTDVPSVPDLIPLVTGWMAIAVAVFGAAYLVRGLRVPLVLTAVALIAVAASRAWWPAAFTPHPLALYLSPLSAAAAAVLVVCVAVVILRDQSFGRGFETLVVVFILGVAFVARWQAFAGESLHPLSPDATTVMSLTASMRHPFDTGVREPAWIWGLRACEWVWGSTPAAARLFSLIGGMFLLVASYLLARAFLGNRFGAVIALLVLTRHGYLITSSVAAHRTELYAICLVTVAFFALVNVSSARTRTIGLATGFALTLLTQTAGGIPAAGAAIWCCWRRRISVVQLGTVLLVGALAIAPHALETHNRFGQAFYFGRTMVPTFYRNFEFMTVRRAGCDGCPTPEQFRANSYSGRSATMGEYLFRLHSGREVLSRIWSGYLAVFVLHSIELSAVLGSGTILLYVLYLAGFATALATRARELLLIPLLSLNLLAFVVPVHLVDPRLLLQIAPFAAILIALFVLQVGRRVIHAQLEPRTGAGASLRAVRIIARLNMGGPARHTVLLDAGLRARGFETLLVHGTLGEGEGSFEYLAEASGVPTLRIPALGRRLHPWDDARAFVDVFRTIRRLRPDIVHTHTAKAGALGRVAAALHNATQPPEARCAVLHTFHGHVLEGYFGPSGSVLARSAERLLSALTDCAIVISPLQRRDLVDRFRVLDPARTVIVPLGLELAPLFALPGARQRAGGAPNDATDAFVVGFVGRLVPVKNVGALLNAVALARHAVPGIRLVITGEGPERGALDALAADLGIAGCVEFAGWRDDLTGIYDSLDVVVLSSLNEGTPVAIIEAMAAGVPVVASTVGGVPDVVEHEVTGLLTSTSPHAIAESLARVARDPEGARQRAVRAREFVRERFGAERLVARIAELYREVLDRKREGLRANSGKLPSAS